MIKEIRSLGNRNQPLHARYVIKNHPALFEAARRHYGKWRKALRAAGINTPMLKNRAGRRNLLKRLRNAFEKDSRPTISKSSKRQLVLYFGSLQNAKIALKTDTKVLGTKGGFRRAHLMGET